MRKTEGRGGEAAYNYAMPNDYHEFFFHEVCRLNTEWFTLEQLFLTKHEHELYAGRTGLFFAHLHFYLHEAVYLRIAKLFDNDSRVASLPQALKSLGLGATDPRMVQLNNDYQKLKMACKLVIDQRNELLAHNNRQMVFNQKVVPVPTVDDVREVMDGIRKLVNKMRVLHGKSEIQFESLAGQTGVGSLLQVWAAGNEALDATTNSQERETPASK